MPHTVGRAATFMRRGEDRDRANARVADKLMLALPRELDAEQRAGLVRQFAEEVTQGKAPWLAAFHDKGKDRQNPHAHLMVRDRDPETGRRVAGLSEKGSTERLRTLWEQHANKALEMAGRPEHIDRRTLEAQGLQREPTIHEGPKSREMDARGASPASQVRTRRNAPGAKTRDRIVDYRAIDGAQSRPSYNRELRGGETPADYWAAIDGQKRRDELEQLRAIHHPPVNKDDKLPRKARNRSGENTVKDIDDQDRKRRGAILSDRRTREAESGSLFDNAMEKAYQSPDKALNRIRNYQAKRGDDELTKALADPKTLRFGRRPGSLLSMDGYVPGASKRRRDSQLARRTLPELFFEHEQDNQLLAGAQRANDQVPKRPASPSAVKPEANPEKPIEPHQRRNPDYEPVFQEPAPISLPALGKPAGSPGTAKEPVAKPARQPDLVQHNDRPSPSPQPPLAAPAPSRSEKAASEPRPSLDKKPALTAPVPARLSADDDRVRKIIDQQRQRLAREKARERDRDRELGD